LPPQKKNPQAIEETHFQTRFLVKIWWGIIGPFELEGRLTGKYYDVSYKKSCHSHKNMCLWKSGGRCGCSKMAHPLILVVLPFYIDSFQTVW
jgi:hypothetical protein